VRWWTTCLWNAGSFLPKTFLSRHVTSTEGSPTLWPGAVGVEFGVQRRGDRQALQIVEQEHLMALHAHLRVVDRQQFAKPAIRGFEALGVQMRAAVQIERLTGLERDLRQAVDQIEVLGADEHEWRTRLDRLRDRLVVLQPRVDGGRVRRELGVRFRGFRRRAAFRAARHERAALAFRIARDALRAVDDLALEFRLLRVLECIVEAAAAVARRAEFVVAAHRRRARGCSCGCTENGSREHRERECKSMIHRRFLRLGTRPLCAESTRNLAWSASVEGAASQFAAWLDRKADMTFGLARGRGSRSVVESPEVGGVNLLPHGVGQARDRWLVTAPYARRPRAEALSRRVRGSLRTLRSFSAACSALARLTQLFERSASFRDSDVTHSAPRSSRRRRL
jgi:hypothetical protein